MEFYLNNLSWSEVKEVTNLDTALVKLGLTYRIENIPGVGKCYVIDNYLSERGEHFAVQSDSTLLKGEVIYRLYRIAARNERTFFDLNSVIEDLIPSMNFYH